MNKDDYYSYSDMYIAFITFDGEVIEKGIDTPKPRNDYEIAMGMVYHRQLSFAQAVILYDNRHVEICRFEVNRDLYDPMKNKRKLRELDDFRKTQDQQAKFMRAGLKQQRIIKQAYK